MSVSDHVYFDCEAIERFATDQALSLEDTSSFHRTSQYAVKFPNGAIQGILHKKAPETVNDKRCAQFVCQFSGIDK